MSLLYAFAFSSIREAATARKWGVTPYAVMEERPFSVSVTIEAMGDFVAESSRLSYKEGGSSYVAIQNND